MGHYSQTCLISRLPIQRGTPIRVCILSSYFGEGWSFRSIPFRAEYDDYGSIENVPPEDQVLVDLALAQFNRDAVEIPQGDNPYHDSPVTRGMPEEGWWRSLRGGRLRVREISSPGTPTHKVRVPKGVPTWRRIQKLLARSVSKGNLVPGSTSTRLSYGIVRVTYRGDYEKRGEWYREVRTVLERRYRVTERYEHGPQHHRELLEKCPDKDYAVYGDVWFEVTPKEGPYPPENPHLRRREARLLQKIEQGNSQPPRKTLGISWAFIREDVWQAILPLGGTDYTGGDSPPNVEASLEDLKSGIREWREHLETSRQVWERRGLAPDQRIFRSIHELRRRCPVLDTTPPFVQGMSEEFEDFLGRYEAGSISRDQYDRVLRTVAEYRTVRALMYLVCVPVLPTYGGPQDGEWGAHSVYLKAVTPVLERILDDNAGPDDKPQAP